MIYTAVSERNGSFANLFVEQTVRFDAYRGHFGYKGDPIIYRTVDDLPFCVVLHTDKRLTGWFEHHVENLINPALAAIQRTC